jgi:TupA-like ATPgrasp
VATCADWLERSYYRESREVVYRHIAPRILIEKFIDDGHGATPHDYKLFVFGGSVEMIQTDMNRFGGHRQLMYSPAWKKLDVRYVDDDAQILGREWDFIRVDFYDTPGRLYFGELTLTPNEGCVRFRPPEFDAYLGSLWKSRGRTD